MSDLQKIYRNGEWVLYRDYKALADRIEELEADLRKMALDYLAAQGQAAEAYQAQLAAEAKLNKAMGALEKVQAFVRDLEPHADQGHTLVPALREACETLAELNYDERSEKKGED
jgi:DNA repair exonuclease SbcCD ATPase subunit